MLDWMLNAVLLLVCFVVAFFFLKRRDEAAAKKEREKALAAAAKDKEEVVEKPYSLTELREYDGSDENKPILLAVNYKVYDVTKGKEFYGRGGSYEALAGRDASRALATMDLSGKALSSEWDELSDLGADDWGTLKDWELNFSMKYKRVGWLEKEPGKDSTENEGADQPVVKEVESVGPNQKEDTIGDPLDDGPPQNGEEPDESQPDENQPAEETEVHVKDSVEQGHDHTEQSNDQTEADDQDHQGQDDQDQQQDQMGQDDQGQQQDQMSQDNQDKHHDQDKQDQMGQSPEAKEEESQDPVEENQEGNKNEVETSQGDQEQDENSI